MPFAFRKTGFVLEIKLALIVEVVLDRAMCGKIGLSLNTRLVQMMALALREVVIIVLMLRGGH